ncbi:hypothetical protein Tco_0955852 [Tanacetum coccineum]|uniref:Uncharacterized protein n=1 Tax=Tanacetum coccineum TaxID=301880 RepID=A0ABQ5E8E2_9ASTR
MSMLADRSNYINVSESAQDTDVGLGEADSETLPKRIPEQVKPQKIQAGVQVSRLEDKDVIFSIGSVLDVISLLNTKFVNHLPKWSRFVTRVKQARNLHEVSFDQMYEYLKQNEPDANEVHAMKSIFPDPLTLIANIYNPSLSYSSYKSQYNPLVLRDMKHTDSPCFTKMIIDDLMKKYESIPKRLDEEYHTIKDDTPLVNIDDRERDDIIKVTQLSLAEAKAVKVYEEQQSVTVVEKRIVEDDVEKLIDGEDESSSSEFASTILLSDEDSDDRIEPESHKENPEAIVDDEEKKDDDDIIDEKKDDDDDNDDDDDHDDRSLIRTQRTGSLKIRTEQMRTPIPSPLDPLGPTYLRIRQFLRIIARMCRRQGIRMQHMKKTFVTNSYFQEILEKVNEALKEIVPKLAQSATNDLINDNLPRIHMQKMVLNVHPTISTSATSTFDLQQELYLKMESVLQSKVDDPKLWNALKAKYEKSSASTDSCRYDAFRKCDHDDHPGDDAPPDGEKSAKRQKMSRSSKSARGSLSKKLAKESNISTSDQPQQQDFDAWVDIPVIDKDEVILEDETLELLNEFQNVDKRVPTIFDHERMEATIKDMLSNQFRDVEEYVCHLEQAKNYIENQINGNTKEKKYVLSLHKIHATLFPEEDLEEKMIRWLGIESYHIKINLTTLTLTGIEACNPYSIIDEPSVGLIYLNIKKEKRVIDLVDIPKFCDATLEKVLKEVKLKIFETEFKMKTPLDGELDLNIMKAFEREIMNHLKHRKWMRRWESFERGFGKRLLQADAAIMRLLDESGFTGMHFAARKNKQRLTTYTEFIDSAVKKHEIGSELWTTLNTISTSQHTTNQEQMLQLLYSQKQVVISITLLVLGLLCGVLRLIYKYATAIDVTTTDDALSRAMAKPSGKNTLCDSQETIAITGSRVLKRRSEPTASRIYTSVITHVMNTLSSNFAPEKLDRKHMWYSLDNFSIFFRLVIRSMTITVEKDLKTWTLHEPILDTQIHSLEQLQEFLNLLILIGELIVITQTSGIAFAHFIAILMDIRHLRFPMDIELLHLEELKSLDRWER